MKIFINSLTYFTFVLFLASCALTDQQRAESIVKEYLKKNLNDSQSYESVSFGELRPQFADYETTSPEGIKLKKLENEYDSLANMNENKADSIFKDPFAKQSKMIKFQMLGKQLRSKGDSIENIIKVKSESFKGPLIGYKLRHTFRAKNAFGALMLHSQEFTLSTDFETVFYGIEDI